MFNVVDWARNRFPKEHQEMMRLWADSWKVSRPLTAAAALAISLPIVIAAFTVGKWSGTTNIYNNIPAQQSVSDAPAPKPTETSTPSPKFAPSHRFYSSQNKQNLADLYTDLTGFLRRNGGNGGGDGLWKKFAAVANLRPVGDAPLLPNEKVGYDVRGEQQRSPQNQPAGESFNWRWLLKPPKLAWVGALAGIALAVSGFTILFGPHRATLTPNNGAVLFFAGLALFTISVILAALLG